MPRSTFADPNEFRLIDDMRPEPLCFRAQDNACIMHYHQGIELMYVEQGVLEALMDGQTCRVRAGELVICSSYTVHAYTTPPGEHNQILCAIFPLDFLPAIRGLFKQYCFAQSVIAAPPTEVAWGLRSLVENTLLTTETKRHLSQFILGLLIDSVGLLPQQFSDTSNVMRSILVYLQSNYTRSITLADLANEVNYSCSRLSHLFHDHFHCTFTEYLHSLRCRHARQLLMENDLTVLEISLSAGFDSVRTFYRAFQRMYGMPPQTYKKQLDLQKQSAAAKD